MNTKPFLNLSLWRVAYLGGLAHTFIALVVTGLLSATGLASLESTGFFLALLFPITLPIGVAVAYSIGRQERWKDAWGVLSVLCGYPTLLYGWMALCVVRLDYLKQYPIVIFLYLAIAMALHIYYRHIGALILRVIAPEITKPASPKAA